MTTHLLWILIGMVVAAMLAMAVVSHSRSAHHHPEGDVEGNATSRMVHLVVVLCILAFAIVCLAISWCD